MLICTSSTLPEQLAVTKQFLNVHIYIIPIAATVINKANVKNMQAVAYAGGAPMRAPLARAFFDTC